MNNQNRLKDGISEILALKIEIWGKFRFNLFLERDTGEHNRPAMLMVDS